MDARSDKKERGENNGGGRRREEEKGGEEMTVFGYDCAAFDPCRVQPGLI